MGGGSAFLSPVIHPQPSSLAPTHTFSKPNKCIYFALSSYWLKYQNVKLHSQEWNTTPLAEMEDVSKILAFYVLFALHFFQHTFNSRMVSTQQQYKNHVIAIFHLSNTKGSCKKNGYFTVQLTVRGDLPPHPTPSCLYGQLFLILLRCLQKTGVFRPKNTVLSLF